MKIGVLISSYEGSESVFAAFDEYQDPSRYVPANANANFNYSFHLEFIKKATEKEQLDEILAGGGKYDLLWNFLWGTPDYGHNVAGLEATRHLEELGVPFIGPSSKYSGMTKADVKRRVSQHGVGTAKWTVVSASALKSNGLGMGFELEGLGLRFPVIVKPVNGCGSEYTTKDSICDDDEQLKIALGTLRRALDSKGLVTDILIEEFIVGAEMSVMVLETLDGVIALPPIIYDFPVGWGLRDKILHFENKFEAPEKVNMRLYGPEHGGSAGEGDDPAIVARVSAAAVRAFCALGVRGSGYARVDFRVRETDGKPYLLEVNTVPAFFSAIGNPFGDDMVIERTFPGGHPALIDSIVRAKLRYKTLTAMYDNMASSYETTVEQFCPSTTGHPINALLEDPAEYVFKGSILDLGAGPGTVGNYILEHARRRRLRGLGDVTPLPKFTGVELSPGMSARCRETYAEVHEGRAENVTLDLRESSCVYDETMCFFSLAFLDPQSFPLVLDSMFAMARHAVTLCVEAITPEYNEKMAKVDPTIGPIFDHTRTVDEYELPQGWRLVYKKWTHCWTSPRTGVEVYGSTIRYENERSVEQNDDAERVVNSQGNEHLAIIGK